MRHILLLQKYIDCDNCAGKNVGAAGIIGGGGGVHLSFLKNFDIDSLILYDFVTKNFIGQFIILTTRLTSICHFNSGQQTVNIKTPELLYLSGRTGLSGSLHVASTLIVLYHTFIILVVLSIITVNISNCFYILGKLCNDNVVT